MSNEVMPAGDGDDPYPAFNYLGAMAFGLLATVAAFSLLHSGPDSACIRDWASDLENNQPTAFSCAENAVAISSEDWAAKPLSAHATTVRSSLLGWLGWTAIGSGFLVATGWLSCQLAWDTYHRSKRAGKDQPKQTESLGLLLRRTLGPLGILMLAGAGVYFSLSSNLGPFDDLHDSRFLLIWGLLSVVAILVAGSLGIVHHALRARPPEERSLVDLDRIGRAHRIIYVLIGASLSLNVVGVTSRWNLLAQLPGGASLPSSVAYLFAGLFTGAAALLILPGLVAWMEVCEQQIQATVAGGRYDAGRGDQLGELRKTLGVEGGVQGQMLGALTVSSPLAAAILSAIAG